jgi:SAM-dependent methyltransferase
MEEERRFGYEWDNFDRIVPEHETQFLKWIYPLTKKDFKNKSVLDAGCGMGRNSYWILKYGAKKVLAFDYDSRTVNMANKNLSEFENANVKFQSIYEIDYKNTFDIVLSIGVIHHLQNPEKAIYNLVKAAKKNGVVLIWVYGYEGNEWVVKYINPVRYITSRIHPLATNILAYFFSIPLYLYLKLIDQRNKYLKQLSKFKFWHVHSIIFDQLLPKIANYWKKEEVLKLFENKNMKDARIYKVNNNSWTVIGKRV